MTATSSHGFGDVVLVPFPFSDQSGLKKRPAVIVSSNVYNSNRRDVVILAITSQVHQPLAYGDAMIEDWRSAGLVKASVLKPVIATLEQRLVIRALGALNAADAKRLRGVLAAMIG